MEKFFSLQYWYVFLNVIRYLINFIGLLLLINILRFFQIIMITLIYIHLNKTLQQFDEQPVNQFKAAEEASTDFV